MIKNNTVIIDKELRNIVIDAIKIANKYQFKTGRKLGITGEIAEVIVCDKLNLRLLSDRLAKGFDALDKRSQKTYQIKSKQITKAFGRIGRFSYHKFDYAILALFDKNYQLTGIWQTSYKKIIPIIEKEKRRNPNIKKFISVSKKIWTPKNLKT